jgi:hypothetical protein
VFHNYDFDADEYIPPALLDRENLEFLLRYYGGRRMSPSAFLADLNELGLGEEYLSERYKTNQGYRTLVAVLLSADHLQVDFEDLEHRFQVFMNFLSDLKETEKNLPDTVPTVYGGVITLVWPVDATEQAPPPECGEGVASTENETNVPNSVDVTGMDQVHIRSIPSDPEGHHGIWFGEIYVPVDQPLPVGRYPATDRTADPYIDKGSALGRVVEYSTSVAVAGLQNPAIVEKTGWKFRFTTGHSVKELQVIHVPVQRDKVTFTIIPSSPG